MAVERDHHTDGLEDDGFLGSFPLPFTAEAVLEAYRHGVFPMGEEWSDEIHWFRPDPRAILPLDRFHVPRSVAKVVRQGRFETSVNRAFSEVVRGCAENRPVWISPPMLRVYNELHRRGHAHSIDVWQESRLVGGLYGVQVGAAFMAESKFYRVRDASKVALVRLVERLREREFELLEVQYLTPHLERFGAVEISLKSYLSQLRVAAARDCRFA